jgi:3-oxochol-4-en-24-oyl-CoA dehydrogenase
VPIAIAADHEELRRTARRFLESRCSREVPRALLDAEVETMPGLWTELAAQGWLGLHVAEEHGGQGFGLLELAVVLEELARALAPGPALPTVITAAVAAAGGDPVLAKEVLPSLVDGTGPAAIVLPGAGTLEATDDGRGALVVNGVVRPVMGGAFARFLCAPVVDSEHMDSATGEGAGSSGRHWCVFDLSDGGFEVEPLASLDLTRRLSAVRATNVALNEERRRRGVGEPVVRALALVLASAECAGGARWCLETATQYAIERHQFGRPIGQFQAIKHRLADMLLVVEQVTALAWDAARAVDADHGVPGDEAAMAAVLAGALAFDAYVRCAEDCIQVLGGMGFTWEHDAHLHLRRSLALRQLFGGGSALRVDSTRRALGGARRRLVSELPEESEPLRREIQALVAEVAAADDGERRARLVDLGLLVPHWPPPWGRGSGPLEQLVIDEELLAANIHRPHLAVGAWALPTIIAHGTETQQQRWVGPTLRGELVWCQLFSEPGAGSDLAALSTRATRVEGGWVIDGQKVWTSLAMRADWGICLARTDPDAAKHEGITYFVVDMRSPGIEVRPLREITGDAMFNEVFLTEVFVPDECVVGPVNGGWRLARTTLANERVSMASGTSFGWGVEHLLRTIGDGSSDDVVLLEEVGALLVEAQSLALLGARSTLRSVSGVEPGPEASIRKLLGGEHEQRLQEMGLGVQGPEGATTEGESSRWSRGLLSARCLTIAGGTSEVQRNVIGERLLGLPRDPEPGTDRGRPTV